MNLKDLKNKVVRNLPVILAATAGAAVATTIVVVVVNSLRNANLAASFKDNLTTSGPLDLSNIEETNLLFDMIGEATKADITFISGNEAIIFLAK